VRMRRPCSPRHRYYGFEPYENDVIDWNEGYPATLRCTGQCDEDIGMCYCNSTSKYGRIPADFKDPPKTPPQQVGRPLGENCQPNFNPTGAESLFGNQNPEDIYGADGWCEADTKPRVFCNCFLDGLLGDLCEIPVEHFCPNQCSGHGECYLGWCKCHKGYYGHDCAYRLPGVKWDNGLIDGLVSFELAVLPRPWLADVAKTPAAHDVVPVESLSDRAKKFFLFNRNHDEEDQTSRGTDLAKTTTTSTPTSTSTKLNSNAAQAPTFRHRPLIYVYELPPKFNQLMLQYRFQRYACTHRLFEENNVTGFLDSWHYQSETAIHEMLLQSTHRTLNPEEADFFYMPVYLSCFYWPVFGAADFPWFHGGPIASRVSQGVNLLLEMFTWVRSHRPYWDRKHGKDHILLISHDEGSCHVPAVLRNATILTHWGRKDLNHTSGTAYDSDVYSQEIYHPQYQPEGHLYKLGNYSCYDPKKDLVIPPVYSPLKYYYSTLHGAPEQPKRKILAFFKGDLRQQDARMIYSRGLRQKLAALVAEHKWWSTHKIWIGQKMPADSDIKKLTYGEALATSIFCFVLPGDGWSGRFEDAILHGCIPVIIQDEVDVSFETLFDVNAFSLRIAQKDLEKIPEILQAVSKEERKKLQNGGAKLMNRYSYLSYKPHAMLSQRIKEDWKQAEIAEKEKNATATADAATLTATASSENAKGEEEAEKERRRRLLGSSEHNLDTTQLQQVHDDAFETLLAFLAEKLKQRELSEASTS
jgi:hypothetical protein